LHTWAPRLRGWGIKGGELLAYYEMVSFRRLPIRITVGTGSESGERIEPRYSDKLDR
jgi:hypothetical protein